LLICKIVERTILTFIQSGVLISVAKKRKKEKENQSTKKKKKERSCAEIKTLVVGLTWFLFSFI